MASFVSEQVAGFAGMRTTARVPQGRDRTNRNAARFRTGAVVNKTVEQSQTSSAPPAKTAAETVIGVRPEAAAAYVEKRLRPQLAWYEAKAKRAKTWHFGLVGTQLVATTMIPVVNAVTHSVEASTVLAAIAAIATGFTQMARHQSHWLRYRDTANGLEKTILHYELELPPFVDTDRHVQLIVHGDRLLGEEGAKWMTTVRSATGKTPAAKGASPIEKDEE